MAEKKITVLDQIEAGKYKVPRFKLLPPAPPILLKKQLWELSPVEPVEATELLKTFGEEQELFKLAQDEHEQVKQKAIRQLQADLEEEFAVTPGWHADQAFKLAKVYAAGNMGQLYEFYTDLVVLVLAQPVNDKDQAAAA